MPHDRKKLRLLTYLCLGIGFFLTTSVQAEVFRSAPLSSGKFSLGMEPELTLEDDTDASFFFHAGFGLEGGYGLHAKIGFGHSNFNDDDVYFGGMIDFPLLRDGKGYPGLYFSLGGSTLGDGAIENHLILHNNFGSLTIYGGIDNAVVFEGNSPGDDVVFPVEVVFGTEFAFSRPVHLLFEGGIELNDSASFISGGLKIYLP